MTKKILFISHDASRTGAPLVLLNLLEYLKSETNISCSLLLINGGGYLQQFTEAVNGNLLLGFSKGNFLDRMKFYLIATYRYIKNPKQNGNPFKILKDNYDYIYSNTVVSSKIGYDLSLLNNSKLILHLHEHDFSVEAYYSNWSDGIDFKKVFKIIAVSNYSASVYDKIWMLPKDKMVVVNEFIWVDKLKSPSVLNSDDLNILDNNTNFIVGACGVGSWRKGFDLFLRICIDSNRVGNHWTFMWIGALSDEQLLQIEYEKRRSNLNNLILTGEVSDPQNYLQVVDVFLLTSREDPFPLVCLEAAALSKPIVCFKNAGGITEFVEEDAGICVNYGDTVEMLNALGLLSKNPLKRNELGMNAAAKVMNYDVSKLAPKIVELFNS